MKLTDLRVLGSTALELCYVACGIIDGYWEYDLSSWDLAGGVLIAKKLSYNYRPKRRRL